MPVAGLRNRFPFFQSLQTDEVEQFLSYCRRLRAEAGTNLWQEGDADNFAAFILDGKLGIKKRTEFGGSQVIVGLYAPGSVVGELCLLTSNPRSVTAEVIETADLLLLHSQNFEEMLGNHSQLGIALLRHIFVTTARRLTKSYERIASVF
ncbi:Crp/Fnr family transcriptional regulator [Desulfuromonas acetexigens]|uniref:Cyclic nucleotide-binding domain-containing protein n=1 Tax=Trichloromonas acetexigens TaxID=38815 RepID=A0A550JIQ8_9BACT|nr:cyclic nucleotide-binding domain-containing protein [Desulfuromonas acetexigens]TRO83107.1 cyclic nucleotide-binding domain-containing protein [Desulfuromonas acetexigens]